MEFINCCMFILLFGISVSRGWDDFQFSVLKEHNRLRAIHGVPPLQLDKKLSDDCKAYAELLRSKGNVMMHHPKAGAEFGECMSGPWGWGWANYVKDFGAWTTDSMYSEIADYDFAHPNFTTGRTGKPVGHFTTIVWKGSTKLGVGRTMPTTADKMDGIIVFRYTPVSYYKENVPSNVLPPLPGHDINTYKKAGYLVTS